MSQGTSVVSPKLIKVHILLGMNGESRKRRTFPVFTSFLFDCFPIVSIAASIFFQIWSKQAGAELCQAQGKLKLVWL